MNLLRLSSLFLAPAVLASIALACGEITDPTQTPERTATVSGALTGTSVPAGARVAVVWRNGNNGGVVVGAEADIVGGKFTMALTAPPDAYFFPMEGDDYDSLSNAPNVSPPAPTPADDDVAPPPSGSSGSVPGSSTSSSGGGGSTSSGGAKIAQKVGTRTNVSGGITEPLGVAAAGFVVYVDANGNGKLDLDGDYASSPDTILGGNKELFLAYLKGGGQLDYEKLRDKSGILPVAGFNLAWEEGRWLPLSLVELKLNDKAKLPSAICEAGSTADETAPFDPGSSSSGSSGSSSGFPGGSYPAADDPELTCIDNGHMFVYGSCPPPAVGLCASDYPPPCATMSHSYVGDTPPAGWPCPITGPRTSGGSSSGGSSSGGSSSGGSSSGGGGIDGGPAPDAGGS